MIKNDWHETFDYMINECSKLSQEYKIWHALVEKVIHWELCKKIKSDHTSKWYIHKPESTLKNETHKILNFEFSDTTGLPNNAQKVSSSI